VGGVAMPHISFVAAPGSAWAWVLLKIYAKCLDGTDAANRQRVQTALGHRPG